MAWTVKPVNGILSVHKRGWSKRINGKVCVVAGKVDYKEALRKYCIKVANHSTTPASTVQLPKPVIITATPPAQIPRQEIAAAATVTVEQLRDKFIEFKRKENNEGRFTDRSLQSLEELLKRYVTAYGTRTVQSLREKDFIDYRESLAKTMKSPFSIRRHVIQLKAMFRWGILPKFHVIESLPPWHDSFDAPGDAEIARYQGAKKRKDGMRIFTSDEIGKILGKCNQIERAIILLGLNCAFGNTDLASLTLNLIDFNKCAIDYPRIKTGADRRCTLWPETVTALKEAIKLRPRPANEGTGNLVFLTVTGLPLVTTNKADGKITRTDSLVFWFKSLQEKAGVYRDGRGMYTLRSTFSTTAAEIDEITARRRIMGHKLGGMDGHYVQGVKDSNLRIVTDYVRSQFIDAIGEPVAPEIFGEPVRPPLDLT